jgi:hypothetical protein
MGLPGGATAATNVVLPRQMPSLASQAAALSVDRDRDLGVMCIAIPVRVALNSGPSVDRW